MSKIFSLDSSVVTNKNGDVITVFSDASASASSPKGTFKPFNN